MNTKFLFNKIVIFLEKYLNIFLSRLLVINKILFPYLIILTYFFLFLESYTYIGFLRKFILVNSRFFLVLSIISVSLIFYLKKRQKDYNSGYLEAFIVNVNTILFLPIVVFYFLMVFLNLKNYPNYVFAKYHIQPQNFINLVYLSLLLLFLRDGVLIYINKLFDFFVCHTDSKRKKYNIFLAFIPYLIFFFFLSQVSYIVLNSSKLIFQKTYILFKCIKCDSDRRKREAFGGLLYDYILFLGKNTPEESKILIPPQGFPWPQTGNVGYLRYFLYPRVLINGKEREPGLDLREIDYVLIDYGESNISEYGYTNVWPKFDVNSQYIIYWDPDTGEVQKDFSEKYIYKNNPDKGKSWGLIKVKND